ncbi:MAG: DUF4129 domain-containing protein [Anaerolineae bacterium]|nr:DUF4129 domain-containing protein [Gemmatimonadaceae bacterium]
MQRALSDLSDLSIADTVTAVFSASGYRQKGEWWVTRKLADWWDAGWRALRRLWDPIGDAAAQSPLLKWLMIAVLAIAAGAIIGRIAYALYRRRGFGMTEGGSTARPSRVRGARDSWGASQLLAAEGDFTGAAHALYEALLEHGARQGQLRLHPSKTVGDYVRELRSRSSSMFSRFRDFGRSYDVVIYGMGECDRERYDRLRSLALPIIGADA